jgi:hypothetical protein
MLGRATFIHRAREAAAHDSGTDDDVESEAPLFFISQKKNQNNDSGIGENAES